MFTMQDAINEGWTKHPKFQEGRKDGQALRKFREYDNVDGQAYDRGYEVGMHETPHIHWGDVPGIEGIVGCN